jgi:hypothetical protein
MYIFNSFIPVDKAVNDKEQLEKGLEEEEEKISGKHLSDTSGKNFVRNSR